MECPLCNSFYQTKQNLRKHLSKKFKCKPELANEVYDNLLQELGNLKNIKNTEAYLTKPINPSVKNTDNIPDKLKCKKCGIIFKSNRSIYYHNKNVCPFKNNNESENDFSKDNVLINCIDEMKDEIKVLKNELIGFKNIVANKPTLNYINNGTINNQQNIQNFQINDWGKEDLSFLNHNDFIEDGPWQTVPRLFKKIHFNPAFLKNYNCRIPPGYIKTKLMEIRKDGKWVKCVRFSELAEKEQYLRNLIIDYAEENKDKIPPKKLERITEYRDIMENRDTNSKEYRELISKLEIIAMNDFISLEEGLNALLEDNLELLENF
jgi:hypothetical protein